MPNLKSTVLGFAVGIVAAATIAWALEVKIPPKITARANLVVDEIGNVLFGATPGNVAVTNLPAVQQVQVTNFPPTAGGATGEPWSILVQVGSSTPSASVVTVPADRQLLITDLDGVYNCTAPCLLADSSGARLAFSSDTTQAHSYSTGILFGPGETVTWTSAQPGNPGVAGRITFMGRLLPLS